MRIIGLDIRNADDKGENERSPITSDTKTRLLNQEPNRQTISASTLSQPSTNDQISASKMFATRW
jgi:hypothetical protein